MNIFKNIDTNKIINTIIFTLLLCWAFSAIFYVIGSHIEQEFYPVRIDQQIKNVNYDRDKGYLCWDWYSIKTRKKPATNMGVVLNDADNKRVLLTTFNRYNFMPWQLSNPVSLGKVNQPLCVFIPPGYKPKEPFFVSQYVEYPGFLNLWGLTTRLPTIKFDHNTKNDFLEFPEISKPDDTSG